MTFAGNLSRDFDPAVRQRGSAYFAQGRVTLVECGKEHLRAEVHGSRHYQTECRAQAGGKVVNLHVTCTCPHFAEGDYCKHLWATFLAADQQQWVPSVLRKGKSFSLIWADSSEMTYDWDQDSDPFIDSDDPAFGRSHRSRRQPASRAAYAPTFAGRPPLARVLPQDWKKFIASLPTNTATPRPLSAWRREAHEPVAKARELWFGLNLAASFNSDELTLEVFRRETLTSGKWGAHKLLPIGREDLKALPQASDRDLLALLFGGQGDGTAYSGFDPMRAVFGGILESKYSRFKVPASLYPLLLPRLAATGRFALLDSETQRPSAEPLRYEDKAWTFALAILRAPRGKGWTLVGNLRREDRDMPLAGPCLLLRDGLVVTADSVAPLVPMADEEWSWVEYLRQHESALIAERDLAAFVSKIAELRRAPTVLWPAEAGWTPVVKTPTPRLSILAAPAATASWLPARLAFDYGDRTFYWCEPQTMWVQQAAHQLLYRDAENEAAARTLLMTQLGASEALGADHDVCLSVEHLASLTAALDALGWVVEAEGMRLSRPGVEQASVASGIDWFDLTINCSFAGEVIGMPTLLAALQRGERYIRLGNGQVGLLPAQWLKRFGPMASFARQHGDAWRFSSAQAVFLDVMLAELPAVDTDASFAAWRDKIRDYRSVLPRSPVASFCGELREYQRDGLGWLHYLAATGFGGCLADDMGLGKTVQVLAHLQERVQEQPRRAKPSLIVVPRSLVLNWMREGARFCPNLRLLDYSQGTRQDAWPEFTTYDLIITTYGVLRRDIAKLRAVAFDYAILDEAQAVKNDAAQVAKAARLLQADHRLAMSGTPVENHLGELGSIFEFLNPGMLNPELLTRVTARQSEAQGRKRSQVQGPATEKAVQVLAAALRPFILRRSKAQVLKDLPAKSEQTLYCQLDPTQRQLYDELCRHYRLELTAAVREQGVERSTIQVLQALLRLRQAACHPALIDKKWAAGPSAKLDVLMEQIREVIAGGHKALVFSQFTSLLALLKERLDAAGVAYAYLDGATRNRQARVDMFQKSADLPLFLISLKAGGVGLNLTAADYCFILDPWWNPAAEAQAIDRAHRIGQTRPVFAYRLIAQGTIEEKILTLQARKKDLADAIVSAENSVLRSLTLDDIEMLLS